MNKIAIKVLSVCLSAAMLTGAIAPLSVSDMKVNGSITYAATADEPVELIKNNDCDTTNKYGTYIAGGAEAELSSKDGQLALEIADVGKLNYGVQLYYDILPLYKNGVYRLSFDVSSDTDRFIEAMIQMNGGDYQSYVWAGVDVSSEVTHISKEFTMEYESDVFAKLCFNCGNQEKDGGIGAHTLYFDNIHLELIDDSAVDYTEFEVVEEKIMTNQVGYLPEAEKIAVLRGETIGKTFDVVNSATEEVVYSGEVYGEVKNTTADETDWFADFTKVTEPGKYYIVSGEEKSFEFSIGEDVYKNLLDESVYMFYLQRCGCEVVDDNAGHKACHDSLATVYGTDEKIDVTGGWHDAGDYGRYIVPAAKSVADLLIAYDTNPALFGDDTGIPESGNGVADILDEVRFELEWMLKMQNKETGGVYHKVSCENFPGYVMPEGEKDALFVTPVSTTATADFCASMAMAYEWYLDIDKDFAEKCLAAAESAWKFLESNPDFIFKNPKEIVTGEYGDKSDRDERYWAAAQMYRATGDSKYAEALAAMPVKTGMGWADMGDYASYAYLTMDSSKQDEAIKAKMAESVLEQTALLAKNSQGAPYGETLSKYFWGCNMDVANHAMMLYLADKLDSSVDYKKEVSSQLNYLLGKNPLATCFVTGFGTVSPQNPHHRPSIALKKAIPGMLVGGPNSGLEDSAALAFLEDAPPAKCYIDNAESYSTNEITIYWNSPFVALLADVLTEDNTSTPDPIDPVDITYGDIDANGAVDITDISYMCLYLLKDMELTEDQLAAADVDGDGTVTLSDLARVRQYVSKRIAELGPKK